MAKAMKSNVYQSTIDALESRADGLEGLPLKSDEGRKLKAHLQGVIANAGEALKAIGDLEAKLEDHVVRT